MFHFVVRHFRWLARVPLAPQFFDAGLVAWTFLSNSARLQAIEELEREALRLPGVQPCLHRFGGIGFAIEGREIAHLHGIGLLDVYLTCERAAAIVAIGAAGPHHVFGRSAWISFWVRSTRDVQAALRLIDEAAQIHHANQSAEKAGAVGSGELFPSAGK